ncbi:MAG: sensor histidine kinase [Thiolinea sp.]
MLSPILVIGVALAYLLILFAVAYYADRRAQAGHSVIDNPWVYALSIAVYCTAWTYFGSFGTAVSGGVWFLPIYLGPTLAMVLGWLVIRKMIRIAKTYRITSIADFIASRYGKSSLLAGLVTLITIVGIVPYIALQLKAVSGAYRLMTTPPGIGSGAAVSWWSDGTLYVALLLAGFTIMFGTRHLESSERHEGMVAAIAFESVIKLMAFLLAGFFVVYGLYDGFADVFTQAMAQQELKDLLSFTQNRTFPYTQWFSLTLLAMLAFIFLPRQFQVMVVENVDERHLRRAVWVFPLYLLLINVFVLPIALGGLLFFGADTVNPENYILALPLAQGYELLALFVFVGGLSAATGMVIVEVIAVSTMVCNDLVMPMLLKTRRFARRSGGDLTGLLLLIRRVAIIGILLLGYLYFHLAGEAYALVSIGLISFAAVAQFAPAMLGGMYWKGATRHGALAGLSGGFLVWIYTLMLPSLAKSGWMSQDFLNEGLWGLAMLRPEQLLGMSGLDNLTHSLFWSLFVNISLFVTVSLWRRPSAREASQALLFVDVFQRSPVTHPVFWQGQAQVHDLLQLTERFLGTARAQRLFTRYARESGLNDIEQVPADAKLVQFVETQLTGAIGSASARVMVASVVDEEPLELNDVMRILEEASQLRIYSQALEEKSASLEQATRELRAANQQLQSLDRLKDDFMSSVTHELRTPLTSIRALTELMLDDPQMEAEQRQQFLGIMVTETERLSRLVNQVLDMARIEAGHAEWHNSDVDMLEVISQAVNSIQATYREKGAALVVDAPAQVGTIRADVDRLVQVVLNLLSNAVKYVPDEGGKVIVRLQDEADGITVEVTDNGPGIDPQRQAVVFEKFRRVEDEDNDPGRQHKPGTGLGLPISRQIVEHFGGRIWLHSQAGEGACFGFFLPRQAQKNGGDNNEQNGTDCG